MKMKKTIWLLVILAVLIGLGYWFIKKDKTEMVSSQSNQKVASEKKEDEGPQAGQKVPKEFKYDQLSDLNAELENVNSQVLDSDFTDLKAVISQF